MRDPLILLLAGSTLGALVASCVYPISGQPTEDGGAVICVKVEPPPDAGVPDASPEPPLQYRVVPWGLEY